MTPAEPFRLAASVGRPANTSGTQAITVKSRRGLMVDLLQAISSSERLLVQDQFGVSQPSTVRAPGQTWPCWGHSLLRGVPGVPLEKSTRQGFDRGSSSQPPLSVSWSTGRDEVGSMPKEQEGQAHDSESLSELEPHAGVEDASLERRPDIGRPPAVGRPSRQQQRVEVRLAHVGEVYGVHEDSRLSKPQLREGIQVDVRRARCAVRVVLQALPSG